MIRAWVADNTEKVLPHGDPAPRGASVALSAARNEGETGQIVVRAATAVRGLGVRVTDLVHREPADRIPATDIALLRQHYIHVSAPTTPAATAGWYPDALVPLRDGLDLEPDTNQSLWIRLHVPASQRPGRYDATLTLTAPGEPDTQIPLSLLVRDFTLPDAGGSRSAFAIWYDEIADHYGVPRGSDAALELAERFYRFQLGYRLPSDDLPVPAGLPAAEWLRRAERFLGDERVHSYRIPFDAGDPDRTREIVDGLTERGWLDRGYFYLDEIDEPTAGGHEEPEGGHGRVRELCRQLDEIAPSVPHLVTAEPVPDLEGAVHTWVPLFDRLDVTAARERRRAGERFWTYGCIFPARPYPTYHIDDDLAGARLLSWMLRRYGVDGNLYWSTTIYGTWDGERFARRDPWTEPVAWPGANGDGMLVYPGPGGPQASIRLEAIREGLEDYEYLRLLEEALCATATRLGVEGFDPSEAMAGYYDRVFTSMDTFTRDPATIQAVREAVAERLERQLRPDAALVVARRTGPNGCRIEVVADPGTSVEVDGRAVPVRESSGRSVLGVADVEVGTAPTEVLVVIDDGRTRVTQRCPVPAWPAPTTVVGTQRIPLPSGGDPGAGPWTAHRARVAVTASGVALSTEASDDDRPHLLYRIDGESLAAPDGPDRLDFRVENAGERSTSLYVRFHGTGGRSHDAARPMAAARSRTTVEVPLRLALIEPDELTGFEVGVMPFQPAARLTLSDFALSTTTRGEP